MLPILAAVVPLLLVIALTAVWRRPAYIAAVCGVGAVVAVLLLAPSFTTTWDAVRVGLGAAGLITLSAAVVIIPGLYLNEQLVRRKVHDRLVAWVEALPMPNTHKAPLIVVGLAPALESLTGFGVSLLVTVPLLLAITSRRTALRQAMLGMNVMPWGTLGLATVIGSTLAHQPLTTMAFATALVSAGVFPLFGAGASAMLAAPGERRRAAFPGGLLGTLFSTVLIGLNWLGVVELAGVLAGAVTTGIGLAVFGKRTVPGPPWQAAAPYVLVLGLVAVIRLLPLLGVPVSRLALVAGSVSLQPLSSPGLALAATALILARGRVTGSALRATTARAWKPVLAIGGFTVMAQLMVAGDMVGTIGAVLSNIGVLAASVLAPFVGMLSGYLTGSNVGGNALMMTVQSTVGARFGEPLAFAAIQNSTAGQAVFASMPIVLLVLAIAGGARDGEESELVRYGLWIAGLVYAVTMAASVALVALGGGWLS